MQLVVTNYFRLKSYGLNYSDPSEVEYRHESVPPPLYKLYLPRLIKFHHSPPVKYSYHLVG
jgi:hypothetical protein